MNTLTHIDILLNLKQADGTTYLAYTGRCRALLELAGPGTLHVQEVTGGHNGLINGQFHLFGSCRMDEVMQQALFGLLLNVPPVQVSVERGTPASRDDMLLLEHAQGRVHAPKVAQMLQRTTYAVYWNRPMRARAAVAPPAPKRHLQLVGSR